MLELQGKRVLITGASTGIGAAAAVAFAQSGCDVAVHYNRSRDAAEAVAEQVRSFGVSAVTVSADVRDTDAVRALVDSVVKSFQGIDVLVNNAGSLVRRATLAESTDGLFDEVMQVNCRSVVAFSSAALSALRAANGASIINVTSIAARNGGGAGASLYAASKAFVSTYTKSLAKELVSDKIRVNAVSPGVILTPFQDRFATSEQLEIFRKAIPMGFLGEAADCAGAFLYLASEVMSRYVTGQIIDVNGGQYMP